MSVFAESGQVDLESLILKEVTKTGEIADTYKFALDQNLDHQSVIGALKSLLPDRYVLDEPLSVTYWALTSEGEDVVKNGSPEIQTLRAIPVDGITIAELNGKLGEVAKLGMGICMKNKWVKKDGDKVTAIVADIADETSLTLQKVQASADHGIAEEELKNLKKRKLTQQITRKSYRIVKGPEFREVRVRKVADLTKAMLGNKSEVS